MMEYGHVGMEGSKVTSWKEPTRAGQHVNFLGFDPLMYISSHISIILNQSIQHLIDQLSLSLLILSSLLCLT